MFNNNVRFAGDIILITSRRDHANIMLANLKASKFNFAKIQYMMNVVLKEPFSVQFTMYKYPGLEIKLKSSPYIL